MKSMLAGVVVLGVVLVSTVGCGKTVEVTPQQAKAIAEEAYIYAYPMLEDYKMLFAQSLWKDSPAYEVPLNQFFRRSQLLGPEYTAIVRPNNDTFYSGVWMDLRAEPMILQVPAITDNRYYSFQLIDMYTYNFGYIGTRTTGFGAGTYMIAGPDWAGEKPQGVDKVIACETNFAVALGRTQVFGPDDVPNAIAVQNQYKAEPLSEFLGTEPPAAPAMLDFPPYDPARVTTAEFIGYLNFLLGQVKPYPGEKEMLARFAKIGIGPNVPFDSKTLSPEILQAINEGVAAAQVKVEEAAQNLGERRNGWQLLSGAFGNRQELQSNYLTRAAAAKFGLWGNSIGEAFYPETTVDANGEPLDGSKHDYVLRFTAEELPPVKAFWSLSMYKLPEQLFAANSINRYVISSATKGLKYANDGSLTVYIQKVSPGKDKESNWLPAYDGPFSLQARLYWPKPESLDPLYAPPAVQTVE